jgi:Holliday junction resolvasome RuvABC DNA-binding subunit
VSIEKLKKLKSTLEAKKQERAKVEGQLESAMDALKALGYKNVTEAEKAIVRMDTELDELDKEINQAVKDLEAKYGDLL